MALIATSPTQYNRESPTIEPSGKFNRFQTDESSASTAFPEYDNLSENDDSDDEFSAEIEATMTAVRCSIALFNHALARKLESKGGVEAEIEAEILAATTRETTPFVPIEEQISFNASIGMWEQLAATRNAGRCESGRCRCSVSCFTPLQEASAVSSIETDDPEGHCRAYFWVEEALIFAFGVCLFAFFASIDIKGKISKFLIKFCVSLMVLCISSPWARTETLRAARLWRSPS